jgi:hypothetical protein
MALGAIKELLLQTVESRIQANPESLTDAVMGFLANGILTPGLPLEAALSAAHRERERHGSFAALAYSDGE